MKPILCVLALALAAPLSLAHAQTLPNAWDANGRYAGSIDRNGNLYGPDNRYLGQLERPSMARPQPFSGALGQGATFGSQSRTQRTLGQERGVYGPNGQYLGQVDRSGNFYDSQGKFRGQLR